jgi:hypothetical protein
LVTDSTGLIDAAVAASRAGDLRELHRLIDWRLGGAATMGRAVPGVHVQDRAEIVASGLAELDEAAERLDVVAGILHGLASALAGAREVRAADPATAESVLATLRLPEATPTGLTDDQVGRLGELRDRAAALRQVYLVGHAGGVVAFAVAADTGRLVPALDWTPGNDGAATTPPGDNDLVARSAAECRLYIDLHPCSCGAVDVDMSHHLQAGPGGSLQALYEGTCRRCGLPRRFVFTLDPATPPPPPAYGGPTPSRIICPGQFAIVADQAARSAVLDPESLPEQERARSRDALARALAAQKEVLKFIPAGADAVPPAAFTSAEGRALQAAEPGRFRKARLEAVATAYRDALARHGRR